MGGGGLGGAMVLGKLPVPGHPTIALAVGAGRWGGLVWTFLLSSILSSRFLSLSGRLKYCLKGPLNPKQQQQHQRNLCCPPPPLILKSSRPDGSDKGNNIRFLEKEDNLSQIHPYLTLTPGALVPFRINCESCEESFMQTAINMK